MLLPLNRVTGSTGHDDLYRAGIIVLAVPLGPQFDDFVVKRHTNAPAYAYHHRFAIQRNDPVLKMLHQVLCNQCQALIAAYQSFDRAPFLFGTFGAGLVLIFQQGFNFRINMWLFIVIQLNAGQARLVINGYGCSVFYGTADVIDVDVMAKDSRGVDICCFDRCARKADE